MPRPPLPIGAHGKITCYPEGRNWRAFTNFRDHDGVTRKLSRTGKSKTAAERELKRACAERSRVRGGEITADSKFQDVAERWHKEILASVDAGTRSPSTVDQYRSNLDRHVLPAMQSLRIREATVPRVDAFLVTLHRMKGAATARTARSIVSGVLGLAVRHGALEVNPVRETSRIEGKRRKTPRALTPEERGQWLDQLERDEKAMRWDLPDLSRFMLATGVRVGEALAVYWEDVDLARGAVEVNYTVVRRKGVGLIRKSTKTASGERTLPLPSWAVAMLRERSTDAGDADPHSPVFPDSLGGLRDPSNALRVLRESRGSDGFQWVTSHVFRKTAATILDEAGLTARLIADHLGHSRPSMTQDVYMARKSVTTATAEALESALDMERDDEKRT